MVMYVPGSMESTVCTDQPDSQLSSSLLKLWRNQRTGISACFQIAMCMEWQWSNVCLCMQSLAAKWYKLCRNRTLLLYYHVV